MLRHGFPTVLALAAMALCGCASVPEGPRDPRDRFESINRSIYQFNDALDRGIGTPVTKAYLKITPDPVETGVSNFFENLSYPTTALNDVLQAKPKPFLQAVARLLVNSTLGIGGLFDPATQLGMASGDEDFGQTLGYWHVPAGPYIMLPVLGPSSVRDTTGDFVDLYSNPRHYVNDPWLQYGLWGLDQIDERASLMATDEVRKRAYDPYSFIRSAYFERRRFQVTDGAANEDDLEIFEEEAPGTP
jgi:phospholipid-binding lipoprotein MlaA